ncbi:HepT-like ribonuclease domain-containing protein [Rhodopseudomonas palustris]|uniref:DUF86 domain-containing protein n=1 Tax=Rhodopseudomonas palustris (strain BisB18) TaxID=316056 RepID=Q21CN7_RHOPB
MRSDASLAALRDIRNHIDLATRFIEGYDLAGFKADLRTLYAVTRCLEIISEASRRLSDDVKVRHSQIAWKQISGAGNIYRHDYEEVGAQLVWDTVARALPTLRAVVEHEIDRQA